MFQILVVEDDKDLNRTVCAFLNASGYQATGCLDANPVLVFGCAAGGLLLGIDFGTVFCKLQLARGCGRMSLRKEWFYEEDLVCLPWQYLQKHNGRVCYEAFGERSGD